VETAAPAGVTVAGLNAQLAPLGNPEQAKLTGALNPLEGVTVKVTVPELPEFTVNAAGCAATLKPGISIT
jgi:hypothetical protein